MAQPTLPSLPSDPGKNNKTHLFGMNTESLCLVLSLSHMKEKSVPPHKLTRFQPRNAQLGMGSGGWGFRMGHLGFARDTRKDLCVLQDSPKLSLTSAL